MCYVGGWPTAVRYNAQLCGSLSDVVFFFNDTATTEIYTLSLHDALPIWFAVGRDVRDGEAQGRRPAARGRSEEHTSELQSLAYLVCRLLLEKKNDSVMSVLKPGKTTHRVMAIACTCVV